MVTDAEESIALEGGVVTDFEESADEPSALFRSRVVPVDRTLEEEVLVVISDEVVLEGASAVVELVLITAGTVTLVDVVGTADVVLDVGSGDGACVDEASRVVGCC